MSTLKELKSRALTRCDHCGTDFHQREESETFCCSGCEYVYGLIHDQDLGTFYDLQGTKSAPVGFKVFTSHDFGWLGDLSTLTETTDPTSPSLKLSIEGISCIGCVWLIEKLFSQLKGARHSRIDVQHGEIEFSWSASAFDTVSFAKKLHGFGYTLSPKQEQKRSETKKITWRIALCGAFSLNGMLYTLPSYLGMESAFQFSNYFLWLSAIFATLSMLIGGSYFIRKAAQAAAQRIVHMDLPIAIGLVVAYGASCYAFLTSSSSLLYFDFISTFVFLMLCGKWLQIYAIDQNRNRLASIEIRPPKVSKLTTGNDIEELDTSEIKPGDHYLLEPGVWIPVESKLVSDRACMGMDWINGESESRLYAKGNVVPSGAINQSASEIELIAKEHWKDSVLQKLLQSRKEQSGGDRVAQKWITRYLLSVMVIACVGAITWFAFGHAETAMVVFVSALVVSCPCALGVALPLANELATSRLKLQGVFVRTDHLWNRLSRVSQVVFDKTGTLTRSTLDWTNASVLTALSADQLEALSALTSQSRHPVASTIYETLLSKGSYKDTADWSVNEEIGQGMVACKNGVEWRLGRATWALGETDTQTILSRDGRRVAEFRFEDRPWSDAAFEVDAIQNSGLKVVILSGDTTDKVQKAADKLGISSDHIVGEASPEMKRDWLRNHQGDQSLIVGDGANDSLAFDEALCCGTPAAEKTTLAGKADFYYLGAGIQGVRSLLQIASKRVIAIRLLLFFALSYNLITISLALAGIVTPLLAAILMPLSSIISLIIVWAALRTKA